MNTHSAIWYLTGQILRELKEQRESRDKIVVVPGKGKYTQDNIFNALPNWTNALTINRPNITEKSSKTPKEKKFGSSELREILKYDESGRCINAFQILSDEKFLKISYDTIKSNPGNMVRGSDRKTLDGLPMK